ncbi:murein L,D-transpeptidase [Sphingomonas sp. DBB INV C78]|uniref:L,D-transpeptidase family protein n=1 Tax=Sphingomonas sp. DBB INV C78 TaxID=3349434 RepID=UPI0036D23BC3
MSGFRFRVVAAALLLAVLPGPVLAQTEQATEDETIGDNGPDEAIAVEIRSAVGGKLKAFYRTRGYWPMWVRDGALGSEADTFVAILESADLDGLDPRRYDPQDLKDLIASARQGTPRDLARAELKLSRTLVDYVRDSRRAPTVEMTYLDKELQPVLPTEMAVLRSAAVAPSLASYLGTVGWMNPIYGRLRNALADYRTSWAALPAVEILPGATLRPGNKGDRVRLLRERLGLAEGAVFDKPLAAALRAFQSAHGLPSDAVAGPMTLAALNRPPEYYERTLLLNLERARALPSGRKRYIVVDAGSARLWMYENGEVRDTMKVIVGTTETQTPMLVGMVRYAILNPYWNMPTNLVSLRLAPKMLEGASLSGMGYEALSDWTHEAQILDPATIDWQAVADGRQEIRVRQLPGKSNAMGRVKFMFPNDLGIYLHDTPDKKLFQDKERHFSNGCIRLEDAQRLGAWLFGKPLEPESDAPEQNVSLPEPMPVYITYLTAAPAEKGIAFSADAYGRDGNGEEQHASN